MQTVIISFSVRNSSVSEFFIEIVNQLSKTHMVIVLTDSIQPHPFYISPIVKIIIAPPLSVHNLKLLWFLMGEIFKHKPSVVIGNFSAVGPLIILSYLFGVKTRIAWCHSISSQFLEKRPLIDRKRLVYALTTKIFANSLSTKTDLMDSFKIKPSRIEVFYNALKQPKIINELCDPPQLTFAGRMDRSKGIYTLINAMPIVIKSHPNILLTLIGGYLHSDSLLQLKKIVKELSLEKNIVFLGFQSRNTVLEEFSKSYVTIVPSVVEAFGYVVIESFAVKTPVIGSNTTGISEIIRDNVDGFLFEAKNSKDLAEKIIMILDDKQLREKFSLNCFSRFENKFELTKVTSDIVERIKFISSGTGK